jgi:hypothetical protein
MKDWLEIIASVGGLIALCYFVKSILWAKVEVVDAPVGYSSWEERDDDLAKTFMGEE